MGQQKIPSARGPVAATNAADNTTVAAAANATPAQAANSVSTPKAWKRVMGWCRNSSKSPPHLKTESKSELFAKFLQCNGDRTSVNYVLLHPHTVAEQAVHGHARRDDNPWREQERLQRIQDQRYH